MAYDEGLAERLRGLLPEAEERRMFGGLAFLLRGTMVAGVLGDDLVARVGPDVEEAVVAPPFVRPFDFTGRAMRGWVYVAAEALSEDADLAEWVARCRTFVARLSP